MSPTGTVLDPSGIAITTAPNNQAHIGVAFSGGVYLVVWGDFRNGGNDVYAARVSTAGMVLDPNGFPVSSRSGVF